MKEDVLIGRLRKPMINQNETSIKGMARDVCPLVFILENFESDRI